MARVYFFLLSIQIESKKNVFFRGLGEGMGRGGAEVS